MSKLPRHPKDRGYGYLKACEYPEMNLADLYTFYTNNCVDEHEAPLNYNEWANNHGQEELNFIDKL